VQVRTSERIIRARFELNEDIEFAPAGQDAAGEARYDSPEAVSCGVPPTERAASAGRRRT